MSKQNVRSGRRGKHTRQDRVGQEAGDQVWNAELRRWEPK